MSSATVNEGLIRGLVGDARARAKFGFLQTAHRMLNAPKRGCCGKRARSSVNIRAVKITIFGMSATELKRLKTHLGVDTLVFFLPSNGAAFTRRER